MLCLSKFITVYFSHNDYWKIFFPVYTRYVSLWSNHFQLKYLPSYHKALSTQCIVLAIITLCDWHVRVSNDICFLRVFGFGSGASDIFFLWIMALTHWVGSVKLIGSFQHLQIGVSRFLETMETNHLVTRRQMPEERKYKCVFYSWRMWTEIPQKKA